MVLDISCLCFGFMRFIAAAKNGSCFSLESMDECFALKLWVFSIGDNKAFRFGTSVVGTNSAGVTTVGCDAFIFKLEHNRYCRTASRWQKGSSSPDKGFMVNLTFTALLLQYSINEAAILNKLEYNSSCDGSNNDLSMKVSTCSDYVEYKRRHCEISAVAPDPRSCRQ